jgi:hypothetical protein
LSQLPKMQAEFATTEETSGRAFVRLRTGLLELVDAVDDATGASGSYAEIVNGMAAALDFTADAVRGLSGRFPSLNGVLEANLTIVGTVRQAWKALEAILSSVTGLAESAFERLSPVVEKMAELLRTLGILRSEAPVQIPVPETVPIEPRRAPPGGIFGSEGDAFISGSGGGDALRAAESDRLNEQALASVQARQASNRTGGGFLAAQGFTAPGMNIEAQRESLRLLSAERDQFFQDTEVAGASFAERLSESFSQYVDLQRNATTAAMTGIETIVSGTTDAMTTFLVDGELNFKNFAKSLQRDLLRIAIRMMILRALAGMGGGFGGAIGALFGGAGGSQFGGTAGLGTGGSTVVGTAHTGGVVGSDAFPMRTMPAAMFDRAPRLHSGLAPDEYPAVLQRGEGVFTRGQMAAMGGGGLNVEIHNYTPAQVSTTQRPDGGIDVQIRDAVDKAMASNARPGTRFHAALANMGQVTAR